MIAAEHGRRSATAPTTGYDRRSATARAAEHDRGSATARVIGHDRGSATVWAAGLIAVLLLVGAVGVDLVSAVRARHLAATAADLAALAAAGASPGGERPACDTARGTAEANGAALSDCRLDGWDALVRVEVRRGWTLLGRGPAVAAARAGPSAPGPEPGTPAPAPGPDTSATGPPPDASAPSGGPAVPQPDRGAPVAGQGRPP